jgi:hypothetical protein
MLATVGERIWNVPTGEFVAAWNAAASLDEVAAAMRTMAGGATPRWAVMARAAALRRDGQCLKPLPAAVRSAAIN